jgi:MinD-like ATPase involved in chromosome partitioning or flagellar assembly
MSRDVAGGRIITFYSYKGGTGRSMALANIAWFLAAAGRRVLVVDWDLEAPGLHRYLHPFLLDPEVTATDGVIDFVTEYVTAAMSPAGEADLEWYQPLADLASYAVSLDTGGLFPTGATLDFVPAGRQGAAYASRVNSFDWRNFFDRLGGGRFLDATAERLRREYDYVLIDSRTGVSDTSGICTVTLPDRLVVCFTLNSQSVHGAAAVTESVLHQREALGASELLVFPIPMRVELSEHDRLELARTQSRIRFDGMLTHVPVAERQRYWGDVEVLYLPIYAYEEVLAVFMERPDQQISVLAALERIASHLTDSDVVAVPLAEEDRLRVLGEYMRGPARVAMAPAAVVPSEPYVFITGGARDREAVERLASSLASGSPPVPVWTADRNLRAGMEWDVPIADAIRGAESFVLVVSRDEPPEDEWRRALRYGKVVTPVLVDPDAIVPLKLEGVRAIDLTGDFDAAVATLRDRLQWLRSPEGTREQLQDELTGARRAAEAATSRSEQAGAQARVADMKARLRRLESTDARATGAQEETLTVHVRDDTVRATTSQGDELIGRLDLSALVSKTIELLATAVAKAPDSGDAARVLGSHLHRALFSGAMAPFLDEALANARRRDGPLQLALAFEASSTHSASDLPWEYLYVPDSPTEPGSFLATRTDVVLSRWQPSMRASAEPLTPNDLRILMVDASGLKRDDRIRDDPTETILLETGLAEFVVDPSLSDLVAAIQNRRPSILHLYGTLAMHDAEVTIQLRQGEERAWIPLRTLWDALLSSSPPALVVLDLLAADRSPPPVGIAPLRLGVVAVVELSQPIAPGHRYEFFREFYGAVLRGQPVADAVQRGRRSITLLPPFGGATFGGIRVYVSSPGSPFVARQEEMSVGRSPALP